MPDKSVVFKLISKEISRADHEYMNIHPPPPPPQLTLQLQPEANFKCHNLYILQFESINSHYFGRIFENLKFYTEEG